LVTAFLGGDLDAAFANTDDLIKYKDQIRTLALADDTRFPDLPDVPTFKELGLDLVEPTDRAVVAPAGTPEDVLTKLEAAFLTVARDPEFQAAMKQQGFIPRAMGRAESKAHIDKLTEAYKQLGDLVK
jgi:tripartite-type tricarboxylate transporter receptor subunit TctC